MRETRRYLDDTGRVRTAAIKVPVNEYGKPVSVRFRCTRCNPHDRWVANSVASKGDPMCERHDRVMSRVPIPKAPVLPWSAMVAAVRPYLWLWTIERTNEGRRVVDFVAGSPGWLILIALAGIGAVRDHSTPPPGWAVAGLGAAGLVAQMVRRRLTNRAMAQGKLDDDPETGRRHRTAIASVFRTVAYGITWAGCWMTAADLTGVDPRTLSGRIAWTTLAVLWLLYAATYWRWVRRQAARRDAPTVAPAEQDGGDIPLDPDEAWVRWRFMSTVAAEKGQPVPPPPLQSVPTPVERSA